MYFSPYLADTRSPNTRLLAHRMRVCSFLPVFIAF